MGTIEVGGIAGHDLGGAFHNVDTLAALNLKVSDADMDDSGDSRTPLIHALGGLNHSASTLAALNALINDAVLDDRNDARIIFNNTQVETASVADAVGGTFLEAFTAGGISPPTNGDYLALFHADVDGSAASTAGEIAIAKNVVTVPVVDSFRTQDEGGNTIGIATVAVFTGLLIGDTVHGVFRKVSGAGTTTLTGRRITLIRLD